MRAAVTCLAVACALADPGAACAKTAEYMIRRLVYLTTSCGTESVEELEPTKGVERFRVACSNKSAYPDGLEIACTDPDDDRSCKVLTSEHTFKLLDSLRQKPETKD